MDLLHQVEVDDSVLCERPVLVENGSHPLSVHGLARMELMPGDLNVTEAVTEHSAALWDAALVIHRNSLNIYCLIQTMLSMFEKHWMKVFRVQITLIMACDYRILDTKI